MLANFCSVIKLCRFTAHTKLYFWGQKPSKTFTRMLWVLPCRWGESVLKAVRSEHWTARGR